MYLVVNIIMNNIIDNSIKIFCYMTTNAAMTSKLICNHFIWLECESMTLNHRKTIFLNENPALLWGVPLIIPFLR